MDSWPMVPSSWSCLHFLIRTRWGGIRFPFFIWNSQKCLEFHIAGPCPVISSEIPPRVELNEEIKTTSSFRKWNSLVILWILLNIEIKSYFSVTSEKRPLLLGVFFLELGALGLGFFLETLASFLTMGDLRLHLGLCTSCSPWINLPGLWIQDPVPGCCSCRWPWRIGNVPL